MSEHAVIVNLNRPIGDLQSLYSLEDRLVEAIEQAGVGEFDGNEVAIDLSHGTLFMYGADADALFSVVKPILRKTAFMAGVEVVLRYGEAADLSAREVRMTI